MARPSGPLRGVWRSNRRQEDQRTHKWTVYVRGPQHEDLGHFVRRVQFDLHPSFEVWGMAAEWMVGGEADHFSKQPSERILYIPQWVSWRPPVPFRKDKRAGKNVA